MTQHQTSIPIGTLPLEIQIGKLARQADGAAVVRYGESNAYLSPAEARGVGKTLALPGMLAALARGPRRKA